jgi:putative nucleotidyltransferase with HDIG domain
MNRVAQPEVMTQEHRRSRVSSILADDLPSLPDYLPELDVLLRGPAVDLKRVTRVIRKNPGLSARILHLSNSPFFSLCRRKLSIPEAIVLLGSVRSRTLLLSCAVMEITDRQLPAEAAQAFWEHSFLTAMFSERIARWLDHAETEQAYLGGLLHDIGQLPLLIAAHEEEADGGGPLPDLWKEDPALEREHFAIDHCEVGRWMGISWDFSPSLIDVCEHHHDPSTAHQDPCLVGIVAAGDYFCRLRSALADKGRHSRPQLNSHEAEAFLRESLPRLPETEQADLSKFLEGENLHSLPFPELGPYNEA